MGIRITSNGVIENNVARAQHDAEVSLEKLSSGIRFTRSDPMPADRAISDSLQAKLREQTSYKRNANDGISLVQTAEAALSEVSNITIRLKELAAQAANPAISDKERKFLFVEYQGLYDEIDRVAKTTNYNGLSLLDVEKTSAQGLTFRIGNATNGEGGDDLNIVNVDSLAQVAADTESLGLRSVANLLTNEDGISLDDVESVFESTLDSVGSSFDQAFEAINGYRAGFGAVASRLGRAINVLDVGMENIAAANSRMRDVDYASEVANLTKAKILVQAGVGLLTQGNIPAQAALTLIKLIDR